MKNKKLFIVCCLLSIVYCLFLSSCKKESGSGGNSSIKGKIWVRQYVLNFSSLDEEYAGADEEVYIIYGDETSYGDRIRSDYEGDFEFKYLRKGSYKIYVYSEDSAAIVEPPIHPYAPKIAIIKEVEITDKKQTVDAGTFTILKLIK